VLSLEEIKESIKKLYEKYSIKNISRAIKRDTVLYNSLKSHFPTKTNISEMLYLLDNKEPNCPYGNSKQYVGYNEGYRNCGKASLCQCTRESISASSKLAKSKLTIIQKEDIRNRTKKTNLAKYGVENVGQSTYAKEQHKKYYEDEDNIKNAIANYKLAMLEKYGVDNPKKIETVVEKIKETNIAKYDYPNAMQNKEVNVKSKNTKDQKYGDMSKYLLTKSYEKIKEKIETEFNFELLTLVEDYKGVGQSIMYDFRCLSCNTKTSKVINHNSIRCQKCNPREYVSKAELSVREFLESLGVENAIYNDRQVLNGLELDIYLPDYNFAIEYNGLYWHSEEVGGKNKDYHRQKFKACEEKGIQLFTLFSDSWENKKTIVKNMLINKLGKGVDRIHGRKCTVKEITSSQSKQFLDSNHIQGNTSASIKLGLFYCDDLVSVMTFSKNRMGIGSSKITEGEYELVRYSTNSNVMGGAGKLLSYFEKNYNPLKITSYSDNCVSLGKMYSKLGFDLSHENKES